MSATGEVQGSVRRRRTRSTGDRSSRVSRREPTPAIEVVAIPIVRGVVIGENDGYCPVQPEICSEKRGVRQNLMCWEVWNALDVLTAVSGLNADSGFPVLDLASSTASIRRVSTALRPVGAVHPNFDRVSYSESVPVARASSRRPDARWSERRSRGGARWCFDVPPTPVVVLAETDGFGHGTARTRTGVPTTSNRDQGPSARGVVRMLKWDVVRCLPFRVQ